MKKILAALGIVALALVVFFLRWGSPWTPSHTANYFLSSAYKKYFEPFGIETAPGGGAEGMRGDYEWLLSGDSRAIAAAVEKMKDEVALCLKQDGWRGERSSAGGIAGSYMFSYEYTTLSGRYGHCSVIAVPTSAKAFASSAATQLIVIFYER